MANLIVSNDVDTVLSAANYAAMRSAMDLEIGVDIQGYSATLAAVAGGTYTGSSSITTLGTIGTGTWAATAIPVNKGGTGATDAATARTNLGLAIGSDVQAYNATLDTIGLGLFAGGSSIVTVGTITTGTWNANAIAVNKGGTGATDAATARTNLGLAIGSDVQAYSATLAAVAGGTYVGSSSITTLGTIATGTWAATAIPVNKGGTGATDAATARTNLGLAIGTDVQAYSATLAAVAGGTYTGSSSITTLGTIATGTWSATAIPVNKGGTGATDAVTARSNLGLAINTDVQAYSATLAAVAAGTYTGSSSITTLGTIATGTWAATAIPVNKGGTGATSAGSARTNLGLAIGTDVQAYSSVLDGVAAGNINNVAIGATTASTGKFTTLEASSGVVSALTGFKNRVINGDMRIDQRNEGANVTTAAPTYVTDRWRVNNANLDNLTFTCARSTTNNTFSSHSLLFTVGTAEVAIAADERSSIETIIEGYNVADFLYGTASARTATLSFYVRSSITGTYCICLQNNAQNRSFIKEYTISAANTWEKKTITISGDTSGTWLADNGIGITLRFDLGSGSNFDGTDNTWNASNTRKTTNQTAFITNAGATFYLTDVQLEIGSTATEFERLGFKDTLEACQRYYEKSFTLGTAPAQNTATGDAYVCGQIGAASTATALGGQIFFLVAKRTSSPSVTSYNPYAANAQIRNVTRTLDVTNTTVTGESTHGFTMTYTTTAGSGNGDQLAVNWSANDDF